MIHPPLNQIKLANHHWLDIFDSDGHYFGRVILQWCPAVKKWAHSGNVGTGLYVSVPDTWKYVCFQEIPE